MGMERGLLPSWKSNLLFFGLLIIIVLAYFLWQLRQAHQIFLGYAREHSGMVADVIERNVRGAVLSQEVIEEIMGTFLGNTARFADYLDTIEPFSADELTAFALEAGLTGIRILRNNGETAEGPPEWLALPDITCSAKAGDLQHLAADHLYFLTWPRAEEPGCVIVGLTAAHIEKLHEQIGLSRMLATLSDLAGIRSVRIETGTPYAVESDIPQILMTHGSDGHIAEARVPFRGDVLVVALDARHFFLRIDSLQNEFFAFSTILAILGVFFSWMLHRYQAAYLKRVQDFERELARQREDAALGQAAAAITHEIRNPLNAISMGLQRLQIEVDELDDEYQELIANLLKAVQRTNGIVTDIRRYARPLEIRKAYVRMDSIISHILTLYAQKCEAYSVEATCEIRYDGTILGDTDMLEQVVENLVKNGIEAQPHGGWLSITLDPHEHEVVLVIENSGFSLPWDKAERIFEPYFTTKTRGTGLGLAIARRIIHAHGGRVTVQVPEQGVLQVAVYFPLTDSA